MFRFLAKRSARGRMDELERFLEFWYGPRKPEYGEPEERLAKLPLPYPLRRFHRFAGRWPSPRPSYEGDTFYEGHGGHHLQPLDLIKLLPDGRLKFFMELQGEWHGLTLTDEDDPPVWIQGRWRGGEGGEEEVSRSLSAFLITHSLMTTLYDPANSPCSSSDEALADWFHQTQNDALRIWSADHEPCSYYRGTFYLFNGRILVQQEDSSYRFGAIHPDGISLMKSVLNGAVGN